MTSVATVLSIPKLYLMASHEVPILTVGPSAHYLGLLFLFHQLSCSLVYMHYYCIYVTT